MAVLNIVLPFFLITWGEQSPSMDSALASILNSTVPLFVLMLAPWFLPDERVTPARFAGLLIGFVGVVVLFAPSLVNLEDADLWAEAALLGSAVAYACGAVYTRRNVRGVRPIVPAFFQVGFALAITAVLALVFEQPIGQVTPAPEALVAVLWLGVVGSGLAYLAFFRLLAAWGATRTSAVAYLLPVVGIALGTAAWRGDHDRAGGRHGADHRRHRAGQLGRTAGATVGQVRGRSRAGAGGNPGRRVTAGKATVQLTTVGRRSGKPREVTLYGFDDDDRLVVVGSLGGAARDPCVGAQPACRPAGERATRTDRAGGPRPRGPRPGRAGAPLGDGHERVPALHPVPAQDQRARSRCSCSNRQAAGGARRNAGTRPTPRSRPGGGTQATHGARR